MRNGPQALTPPAQVLAHTAELLSNTDTVAGVTEIVAGAARRLLGADGATFVLREDDLCFYADEDAVGPMWKGLRFPLTSCISGWAMTHRQVVVIPDIYADDRVPHDTFRPTFVTSLCVAPIRSAAPIGALSAYWRDRYTPSPTEVRHLEVLANSAAVALENLELRGAIARRSAERDEAEARTDELESAIHTMVHDLRTPLGAIRGYAELLDEDIDADPERAHEFARTIIASGERMATQIDRMLALYRVTSQPIEPDVVDLSALGREIADQFAGQVRNREVSVHVEDDMVALVDPVLSRLLLENLIGNAFKYTGRKPQATVEVARREHALPMSTFVVSDNGDGFPQEQADRLFRPLSRLHSPAEFPGTGLGLASVARIVDLHGGQIRAEGAKGRGASFFFSLPVPV